MFYLGAPIGLGFWPDVPAVSGVTGTASWSGEQTEWSATSNVGVSGTAFWGSLGATSSMTGWVSATTVCTPDNPFVIASDGTFLMATSTGHLMIGPIGTDVTSPSGIYSDEAAPFGSYDEEDEPTGVYDEVC